MTIDQRRHSGSAWSSFSRSPGRPHVGGAGKSSCRRPAKVVVAHHLLVSGCEPAKSPWRRTLTKAERLAWVTRCGVPAASVRVDLGKNRDENDGYGGKASVTGPAGELSVMCHLAWNRKLDRPLEFSVMVDAVEIAGRPRATLTKAELAPYVDMIADEVPLDMQPVVRRVAEEPYHLVRAGAFAISGGFRADPAVWSLEVQDMR
ncbi:MAG: hypothetical protein IPH80_09610 [Myxococcales bacterium]|nr:hypothetical protein [Myxococcales bacterium]